MAVSSHALTADFRIPPHPSPLPSGERGRVRGKLGKGLGDSNFHLFLIDLLKKVKKGGQAVNIKLYEMFVRRLRVTERAVYMFFGNGARR